MRKLIVAVVLELGVTFPGVVPCDAVAATQPAVELTLQEPLGREWEPQWVSWAIDLPEGRLKPGPVTMPANAARGEKLDRRIFVVRELHPDGSVKRAMMYAYTDLHADEGRTFSFNADEYLSEGSNAAFRMATDAGDPGQGTACSEMLCVRSPAASGLPRHGGGIRSPVPQLFEPPAPMDKVPAPVLGISRRADSADKPLLRGRLTGPGHVTSMAVNRDDSVPIRCTQEIQYALAEGGKYVFRWTLMAHEPVLLIEEDFSDVSGGGFSLTVDPAAGFSSGHYSGRLHPPGEESKRDYTIDFSKSWTGKLQPFYAWWPNYGLWWATFNPTGDYVGILPLEPTKWKNPAPNSIQIRTGPDRKIEIFCPFNKGTRKWTLLLSTSDEALKKPPGGANLMQRMLICLGQNPLDKVKDMVLTWPGMDDIQNPRLLCTADELPGIRKKAHSHPLYKRVLEQYPDEPGDPAGLYLATGDEKHARQAIDDLIPRLRRWLDHALGGPGYSDGLHDIGFVRPLRSYALVYDAVAASRSMTPAERNYCLRAFAFLAYLLYDEDRWPPRHQGFHRGNVNFHSDDYTCRAAVVCLLKGHPKQKEWMAYVEREMALEFEHCVSPGGAWCEAPNYQGFTMHYLMIAMRIMQLNGFKDFAVEPRFRQTMDYFFRIQTPRDVRCGVHLLPTVGDTTSYYHSQSLQNTFSWAAKLFKDDPRMAGEMMHAWQRCGSMLFGTHGLGAGNGWIQPLLMTDPDIPAVPPAQPLQSERLPGYGAIFRNNYDSPRESYFLFKMGQIDQHFDSDEGSFHWYALGKPLSLDFGSMYTPSIEQPWLHSTIDFDLGSVRHRPWNRGEVSTFISLPEVDFCGGSLTVTHLQPQPDRPEDKLPESVSPDIQWNKYHIGWRREVLFVKGPDYIVVRDDLDDAQNRTSTGWTVQVLASRAVIDGSHARLTGQHGVDMAILAVEPPDAKLSVSTWGHPGRENPRWMTPDPFPPMGESQIAVHMTAPVNGDYLAVLFPFAAEQPPPRLSSPRSGVLKAEYAGQTDMVFFMPLNTVCKIEDVTLTGRVALVRRAAESTRLHILDGTSLQVPEMTAQFPGPVSLEIGKARLSGVSQGPTRTCFLHWTDPPPIPAELTIDGQGVSAYSTDDGYLSFTVPEGTHRFEVRYPSAPR